MRFEALQLKVCEGCGRLWYRPAAATAVYCAGCAEKLAHYPLAGMERRAGRKRRVLSVQEASR